MDLVAGFPYIWGRVKENVETVFNANRLSNISLEIKWRFFEKDGLGLALKPGITLPTGNHWNNFNFLKRIVKGQNCSWFFEQKIPMGSHTRTGWPKVPAMVCTTTISV
ncbi:MAG: hypothetical protein NT010_03310 [Proteobacteria bacterium]|nr:hypothetical protein [Pseudomonadota bacterium]